MALRLNHSAVDDPPVAFGSDSYRRDISAAHDRLSGWSGRLLCCWRIVSRDWISGQRNGRGAPDFLLEVFRSGFNQSLPGGTLRVLARWWNIPIVRAVAKVDVEMRACEAYTRRGSDGAGEQAIVPGSEVELLCLLAQPIQMFRAETVCPDVSGRASAVETDMIGGVSAGDSQKLAEAVLECSAQLGKAVAEVLAGEVFGSSVDERLCAASCLILILQFKLGRLELSQ